MHELSISNALLEQVSCLAAQYGAVGVSAITLRLGPLSGVEPALLRAAYMQARMETVAEHAPLVVVDAEVRIACLACGAACKASPERLACGECGSAHTRLLSGDEMLLESVDLVFLDGSSPEVQE